LQPAARRGQDGVHRLDDPVRVGEDHVLLGTVPAEERAAAHPEDLGELVHAGGVEATLDEQPQGGFGHGYWLFHAGESSTRRTRPRGRLSRGAGWTRPGAGRTGRPGRRTRRPGPAAAATGPTPWRRPRAGIPGSPGPWWPPIPPPSRLPRRRSAASILAPRWIRR